MLTYMYVHTCIIKYIYTWKYICICTCIKVFYRYLVNRYSTISCSMPDRIDLGSDDRNHDSRHLLHIHGSPRLKTNAGKYCVKTVTNTALSDM